MNTENFKEFLENPSRLYQLSYQELKSLVLQYPYSTNLHYLLLQKSAMEDHRELEPNLQKAATYSINRTFLFKLLNELTSADKKEPFLQLDEEFLELKDLSLLEITPLSTEVVNEKQEVETSPGSFRLPDFISLDVQSPVIPIEEEELDLSFSHLSPLTPETQEEVITSQEEDLQPSTETRPIEQEEHPAELIIDFLPFPLIESSYQAPAHLIGRVITISAITGQLNFSEPQILPEVSASITPPPPVEISDDVSPSLQLQKQLLDKLDHLMSERAHALASAHFNRKPAPQPKGSFTSWVQQFQPDHVKHQLSELMEAKKREELKRLKKNKKKVKKKKKHTDVDQRISKFAEQSLNNHQTIVSETLAELLAEQGEIHKSIKMYERLKLFFPEKSAYFAAIIEKLKIE